MEVISLASGSKGNSTLIKSGTTTILVDAGLSLKELGERLSGYDIDLKSISAVLVSHEHIDHIRGVGELSRAYKTPVYASSIIKEIVKKRVGSIYFSEENFDNDFFIGDIKIETFRLPHDAKYTVGFKIDDGKSKFCIATDLGCVTDSTLNMLQGCSTVLLESNYDINMLKNGRYHYALKNRIASGQGHLSNQAAALCAATLVDSGAERIILGHLSEENNSPEIAFDTVLEALNQAKIKEGKDAELCVAFQHRPSRVFKI